MTHCECHHDEEEEEDEEGVPLPGRAALQGPPAVKKGQWKYFERKDGDWPGLNHEKMFGEVKAKLDEKVPTKWVNGLKEGSTAGINLIWRFDFGCFGKSKTVMEFNVGKLIAQVANMPIVQRLRLVLVFIVYACLILAVLRLLFHAK